jgi:hypothetical protein
LPSKSKIEEPVELELWSFDGWVQRMPSVRSEGQVAAVAPALQSGSKMVYAP